MEKIEKTAVVGAGTMGSGIAHVFALGGYDVALIDTNTELLEGAHDNIGTNLARQAKKGVLEEQEIEEVLGRISMGTDMNAVEDAGLVIEAVFEKIGVKEEVFRKLDEICPDGTILASNTSSISITQLASFTERPDRVIGMHFFNPVPVMKLVEIVRGYSTSDDTFCLVRDTTEKLGKSPVEVNDYPGFISNRLLMPLINEAAFALMEGVASREDIDAVMKLGMAHPMGPLELADFIGLDVCLDIMRVMQDGLGDDKYRPCPLLKQLVAAGNNGRKSGRGFYEYK